MPSKKTARQKKLKELSTERRTLILFEAPHRLASTLGDIAEVLGDMRIALPREPNQLFEEVIRGRVSEVIAKIEGRRLKGEMTLLLEGAQEAAAAGEVPDLHEYLKMLIEEKGLSLKDAVSKASKDLDIPRKRVYKEALNMQKL